MLPVRVPRFRDDLRGFNSARAHHVAAADLAELASMNDATLTLPDRRGKFEESLIYDALPWFTLFQNSWVQASLSRWAL